MVSCVWVVPVRPSPRISRAAAGIPPWWEEEEFWYCDDDMMFVFVTGLDERLPGSMVGGES